MNENATPSELLIRYLDGELDSAETAAAERQIAADTALQEELAGLRLAKEAVHHYGVQQTVRSVRSGMKQEEQPAPVVRLNRRVWRNSLRVAAGIIIVLGATFIYQYSQLSNTRLYEDNYKPFLLHESRGADATSVLQQAYKAGQPGKVIQLYRAMKNPGAADYLLAGNALLEEGQPAEATQCFLLLQQQNTLSHTHLYEDDAEYYLALSYLRGGEVDQALPLFERMHADETHLYHDKASTWFIRKLHWLQAKHK
jgi:tetratricopeptide (TPR) repeat protein